VYAHLVRTEIPNQGRLHQGEAKAAPASRQEHLSPQEVGRRYFQGRTDSFRAREHAHFAWAKVA
jgi:hypothetical protein